jgi:hypothetical protein
MSALPPTASTDEIEEELVFLEVLIASLDAGADDYAERLATFQTQKEDLESRLAGGSRPQTSEQPQNHMQNHIPDMDGSNDQSNAWWQTTLNGRPGSNGGQPYTSTGGEPYSLSFGMGTDKNLDNGDGGQSYTSTGGGPYSLSFGIGTDMYPSNGNGGQPYASTGKEPYSHSFGMGTDMNLGNGNCGQSYTSTGGGPYSNNFALGTYPTLQPNMNFQPNLNFQPSNPMKRSLPSSLQQAESSQHPSKRPTPEPSNAGTPASSSTESFEFLDNPTQLSERSLQRQKAAEDALRKQREAQIADEQFARSLSQPSAPFAPSSSRPGIQTTLNHNGSFQRPRPQPETQIKREPGFAMQQQLPQRTRGVPEVVDLTNSDDDEDVSEVPPNAFTPNRRAENGPRRPMPPMRPQLPQMPGAFPDSNGYQSVYGNSSNIQAPRYPWMHQQTNPLVTGAMSAVSGIRNVASTLGSTFDELSILINGRSRPGDDDVVFGGSRQIKPDPFAGYSDMDLYEQRRAALEHYDPLKTTEQITALLENIRPDEDMPAHLRVQTPEAMAVKLHKYQELGLTWLQQREDSSNKGGILADDMVSCTSAWACDVRSPSCEPRSWPYADLIGALPTPIMRYRLTSLHCRDWGRPSRCCR